MLIKKPAKNKIYHPISGLNNANNLSCDNAKIANGINKTHAPLVTNRILFIKLFFRKNVLAEKNIPNNKGANRYHERL